MSVTIKWDNAEQSCLRVDFFGYWRWEEIYKTLEQGKKLLDNGDTKSVDIIIDSTETDSLLNKDTHVEIQRMLEQIQSHGRIGRILIVGTSAITNSFLNVFLRLSLDFLNENHVTFYNSLDEAHAYLMQNPQ